PDHHQAHEQPRRRAGRTKRFDGTAGAVFEIPADPTRFRSLRRKLGPEQAKAAAANLSRARRAALLRQPGGFEGFIAVRIVLGPAKLSVADREDLCPGHLADSLAFLPSSPLPTEGKDPVVTEVDVLLDAGLVAFPAGTPLVQEPAHGVTPSKELPVGPFREPGQVPLVVGMSVSEGRFEVASLIALPGASDDLDVLLRHRARSISPKRAAFHARQWWPPPWSDSSSSNGYGLRHSRANSGGGGIRTHEGPKGP